MKRKPRTKLVEMKLTVRVPSWMTAAQARREVKWSVGLDTSGYMSHGPEWQEIKVRAVKVSPHDRA